MIRINRALISTPQYSYTGAEQYPSDQRERWLEIEAEFSATPAFTDELRVRYFVLVGGRILTGEVTHMNVPAGRSNRSVMYVPPRVLARFNSGSAALVSAVQNIAVQLVRGETVESELSLVRAPARWFAGMATFAGFMLNKNETPFAPLYWDRYPQIKSER